MSVTSNKLSIEPFDTVCEKKIREKIEFTILSIAAGYASDKRRRPNGLDARNAFASKRFGNSPSSESEL
jgi:hypothetical protein